MRCALLLLAIFFTVVAIGAKAEDDPARIIVETRLDRPTVEGSFSFSGLLSFPGPETVDLDVQRFMGRWYEIASTKLTLPYRRDCTCVTADYTLQADGNVTVVNTCISATDGETDMVRGVAVPTGSPGRFSVSFDDVPEIAAAFSQDNYWVVDIADDYSWAVVSSRLRTPIYILAREPFMSVETYSRIENSLRNRGFYHVWILTTTQQEGCTYPPEQA